MHKPMPPLNALHAFEAAARHLSLIPNRRGGSRKTVWWGWEDSNFQPNDYQLLASEVPEVARLCVQRLVSAKSRLNFNEAV